MIDFQLQGSYPCMQTLIDNNVASRIQAKDATLYNFNENAFEFAQNFMGWADLASNPPYSLEDIQAFADYVVAKGLKTVVLVGQGGSTQAPMTITKYNKSASRDIVFKTIDSVSPVRVRSILHECNPRTTLVIQSSKSGSTLEPSLVMKAVRKILAETLSEEEIPQHLVAITDPGSSLEKQALEEGWLKVFSGEPTVGGRYSALSVFGLVPAALVGINLDLFMKEVVEAEKLCATDSPENPALQLASFLYDGYENGRDKFCFLTPKRGRVLGLWIEQLIAESLGKGGKGILPNIETDSIVLSKGHMDRSVVIYHTQTDFWDEQKNFEAGLKYLSPDLPCMTFHVDNVEEVAAHLVMWEYATAMIGYLMKVCPFDQPDVQIAKTEVLNILSEGVRRPDFRVGGIAGIPVGPVEVFVSDAIKKDLRRPTLEGALEALVGSIRLGDYFSINAFLPFTGEGRREAMEQIRHRIAEAYYVPSCLEIGPRYLHSTGQLHKGGPNNGVFLIVSATETRDIEIDDHRASSLGELAKAQAAGDFAVLSERGRRCVHVHLPDNSAVTIRALSKAFKRVVYMK